MENITLAKLAWQIIEAESYIQQFHVVIKSLKRGVQILVACKGRRGVVKC